MREYVVKHENLVAEGYVSIFVSSLENLVSPEI